MMRYLFISFCLIAVLVAFRFKPEPLITIPHNWPKPSYNFKKNPLNKNTIALGRQLFYDPILSRNDQISCASCHLNATSFTHIDHALSHGIEDRIGTRNSPVLINLAWSTSFMWDGSVNHLDVQALAPIENPLEMDLKIADAVNKLKSSKKYRALFYDAFGDSSATGEHTLKALSQFMLTLVSSNSKYDKVMRKEKGLSFSENEQKGYELFKINCASCHTEPLFTSGKFENNGLEPDSLLKDMGRMGITKKPADSLKFKVPTLRNCELSYPYMHDGRYKSLQMVLFHYSSGIHHSKTLANQLTENIPLTEQDKRDLIAFLKTLTDRDFLKNPKFAYPKP